jgi:hypothetical protein
MSTTTETMTNTETKMTQVYAEALNFLVKYFEKFDDEELNAHQGLYVSDIVNVLGYATFDDSISPEVGYISNWETLDRLRNEIANRFYN